MRLILSQQQNYLIILGSKNSMKSPAARNNANIDVRLMRFHHYKLVKDRSYCFKLEKDHAASLYSQSKISGKDKNVEFNCSLKLSCHISEEIEKEKILVKIFHVKKYGQKQLITEAIIPILSFSEVSKVQTIKIKENQDTNSYALGVFCIRIKEESVSKSFKQSQSFHTPLRNDEISQSSIDICEQKQEDHFQTTKIQINKHVRNVSANHKSVKGSPLKVKRAVSQQKNEIVKSKQFRIRESSYITIDQKKTQKLKSLQSLHIQANHHLMEQIKLLKAKIHQLQTIIQQKSDKQDKYLHTYNEETKRQQTVNQSLNEMLKERHNEILELEAQNKKLRAQIAAIIESKGNQQKIIKIQRNELTEMDELIRQLQKQINTFKMKQLHFVQAQSNDTSSNKKADMHSKNEFIPFNQTSKHHSKKQQKSIRFFHPFLQSHMKSNTPIHHPQPKNETSITIIREKESNSYKKYSPNQKFIRRTSNKPNQPSISMFI